MIIKKTTEITAPSTARRWVRSYMDEVAKHKNEDIKALGIELGKNYFTSRKPGAVTAHGYAKKLVNDEAKRLGLKGNEAVLAFVQGHCRRQRKKRRKILGIRMIMSLDPERTVEMVHARVDIDRLLVRIAEDTFSTISREFYGGDQFGFLMAIHHDAMTNTNKWGLGRDGADESKPSRPHVHAHLFVLPQTEKKQLRISFSDHSRPLRDGQFIDMSQQLRFTYQNRVHHHVQRLQLNRALEVTPKWEAIIQEAALGTFEDFMNLDEQNLSAVAFRRYSNKRFRHYLQKLDKQAINRRCQKRMKQVMELAASNSRESILTHIDDSLAELEEGISTSFGGRAQMIQDIIDMLKESPSAQVQTWDGFNTTVAAITSPAVKHTESQHELMLKQFRGMEDRRIANRIHLLGNVGLLQLEYTATMSKPTPPEWVATLAAMARSDEPLPNQEVMDTSLFGQPGEQLVALDLKAVRPIDVEIPQPEREPEQPEQLIANVT